MMIGSVGLAAALGAGAYAITLASGPAPEAADPPVIVINSPTSSTAAPAAGNGEKTSGKQAAQAEPSYESPAERVRKAREAAVKDGVQITRPLPAEKDDPAGEAAAASAKEVTIGSAKEGGTMRIVTARGDLTGQRELAWVAGDVRKHGEAACSQRFKLYNEQEPKTRPSLLVCWRTSEKRSVIVVDTKIGGRPPVGKSLAVIEREWRKLG